MLEIAAFEGGELHLNLTLMESVAALGRDVKGLFHFLLTLCLSPSLLRVKDEIQQCFTFPVPDRSWHSS